MEFHLSFSSGLKNLFQKRSTGDVSSIKNPKEWLANLFGWNTSSGVKVDPKTAMSFAAVYAAIRLLSESVASLSVDVLKKVDAGREVDEAHPLSHLLHNKPNALMTSMIYFQTIIARALSVGYGAAIIMRDSNGSPISLDIITKPVKASVINGRLYYAIEGRAEAIPAHDVIYIPAFTLDGLNGISPIRQHAETIGNAISAQRHNGKFWNNGAVFGGVLTMPGKLDDGRDKELAKQFDQKYSDGGTAVLGYGAKYEQIKMSQSDAQYIESMRFNVEEVARIFNVPPHLLQELMRATFNNIEHLDIQFVKYSLGPWLKKIEQELNDKLISVKERPVYSIKFNVNSLLRGDVKTRSQYYKDMVYMGAMTRNEVRRLEGFNTVDDDSANSLLTPVNMNTDDELKLKLEAMEQELQNLKNNG